MTDVADSTLLFMARFAHVQWSIDDLASSLTRVDEAIAAAFATTNRFAPDQVIRTWERKNKDFLLKAEGLAWFNRESWHASVLAGKLNDGTRPVFFTFYAARELGEEGVYEDFLIEYAKVKGLRDFLAHNMAMRPLGDKDRLQVTWFHDTDYGRWMEQDSHRLTGRFLNEVIAVSEWLNDVVGWTHWKASGGYRQSTDNNGAEFSDNNRPSPKPPFELDLPVRAELLTEEAS